MKLLLKPLIDNPGIGKGDIVGLNGNPLDEISVNERLGTVDINLGFVYLFSKPYYIYDNCSALVWCSPETSIGNHLIWQEVLSSPWGSGIGRRHTFKTSVINP
jgi:hypothetical protein